MRLTQLVDELRELDDLEKLDWLVEIGAELPASSRFVAESEWPVACRVQECQTPVKLWVESQNGLLQIEADVPVNSPLVRGLLAVIVLGLSGESLDDVRAVPEDIIGYLNLAKAVGMQRQQGMRGVMRRILAATETK